MNRLAILALAASALAPVGAAAQNTVDPPEKWEDTPDARLNVPNAPPPGVTWQAPPAPPRAAPPAARPVPAPTPQVVQRPAPPPLAARPAPAPQVVQRPAPAPQNTYRPAPPAPRMVERPAPPPPAARPLPPPPRVAERPLPPPPAARPAAAPRVAERPLPPPAAHQTPRHAEAREHPHYKRVDRGHRVDRYWSGDDYQVRDHGRYGFYDPPADHRWLRYYDDALLVDRAGMVRDGRYGLDWDQYGGEWGHDERGIPVYVGDGDFYPDDRDYAWVDEHRGYAGGYEHPEHPQQVEAYEGDVVVHHGGYAPAYYPYGYYQPYGAVTVVETVTTTTHCGGCAETVTHHRPNHKKVRREKAVYHPGEKG